MIPINVLCVCVWAWFVGEHLRETNGTEVYLHAMFLFRTKQGQHNSGAQNKNLKNSRQTIILRRFEWEMSEETIIYNIDIYSKKSQLLESNQVVPEICLGEETQNGHNAKTELDNWGDTKERCENRNPEQNKRGMWTHQIVIMILGVRWLRGLWWCGGMKPSAWWWCGGYCVICQRYLP